MLFNLQHKLVSTRTHLHSLCFPLKLCNFDVHLPVQDARFVELLHGVLLNCCPDGTIKVCGRLRLSYTECQLLHAMAAWSHVLN